MRTLATDSTLAVRNSLAFLVRNPV